MFPVDIFELLGALPGTAGEAVPEATPSEVERCKKWEVVYRAYGDRDWNGLVRLIRDYSSEYPSDRLADVYLDRAEQFLRSPPDETWNGVQEYATK